MYLTKISLSSPTADYNLVLLDQVSPLASRAGRQDARKTDDASLSHTTNTDSLRF